MYWRYSLCDISIGTAKLVGQKYNIPPERVYTNFDEMLLDEELDAVIICSKDHCEPTVKAANAKKHVFVEKPFGFNLSEANQMIDAAEQNKVKLMVGYMKRYDTGFEYFLNQIKSMQDISLVRVHDYGGSFAHTKQIFDVLYEPDVSPEIFRQGKARMQRAMIEEIGSDREDLLTAYSLLLGLSSHDSVLLRHAFGDDPEILYAGVHQKGFLTAVLQYGDIRCVFESGLVMKRLTWDESFSVYSPDKNITLKFPWPYLKNAPSLLVVSDTVENTNMPRESEIATSFHEAYRNEWLHFYDCIVNDKEPLTSGRDAIKDIELMSRIIKAVKV
jgi:predicted dehydrogenase